MCHAIDEGAVVGTSIAVDKPKEPEAAEEPTVASMETNDAPQISRKKLLKAMKIREARRKKRKTKRLGGRKSHSKW